MTLLDSRKAANFLHDVLEYHDKEGQVKRQDDRAYVAA